ncbi:MAG: hypothetical protein K0U41_04610 [Gammaproteobacteria bacterium]|nr:hypothetical protein [Gammaproteobacteria bacterium]
MKTQLKPKTVPVKEVTKSSPSAGASSKASKERGDNGSRYEVIWQLVKNRKQFRIIQPFASMLSDINPQRRLIS